MPHVASLVPSYATIRGEERRVRKFSTHCATVIVAHSLVVVITAQHALCDRLCGPQ